ncbi:anti-sigma regulatory factor (Ser/Thr protein kinase) [Streptosporangium becharense]|uniref:Anti-sigma regulatory factor (Ser/Thr protein kinase) n=1 Tax=Streptosporangium becharense TaxID=1816182 RepID=A0A7W9ILE9_9ACTN|nr:ATP-binding protein [Streptosporangium becharense]MBB2913281.1 anti-sigma regulatory factor (Ser/Thr protein kinase) [Streptosporangium becharense]MBB5822264.1 anti-sigma regulatory factor (Ser/Thr protein kinase) [Streptosporangium becharense]
MEEAVKASAALTECRYTMNPALSPLGEKWVPREARNIASARRFVRDVAADWNAMGDVPEIAELLTSELVTNAMAYGSGDTSTVSPIRITVSGEKELLTVDVHDSCIAVPRMRRAGDLEVSGRGLAIVQELSRNWGWTLNPYGKSVWFQLVAWRRMPGVASAGGGD